MAAVDYDVIIVGAGISGINMAYRLKERNPGLTYTILEGRHEIGGTWSLFKYPGIRSDSDLYTFGFAWRPWIEKKSIAHGSMIMDYLRDTVAEEGIDKSIQFNTMVEHMNWSSKDKRWTASVTQNGKPKNITGRFIFFGTGYYNYEEPLNAVIPGIENFAGKVIHPQFWPEDLDYSGKQVVVIGSGATGVTLLPSMADKAAHVTMLQRSPSYILSVPGNGWFEDIVRFVFPAMMAHRIIRAKWIFSAYMLIGFCKRMPAVSRWLFLTLAWLQLPKGTSVEKDFTPKYNPWEQRMCLCPDADFYRAIRKGKCSVVTDTIDNITKKTIKLHSGKELNPDIIVTATGLKLRALGGVALSIDGTPYSSSERVAWKGCMLEGLPNAALAFGYVDASWTLGADATAQLISRMLNAMQDENVHVITPKLSDDEQQNMVRKPFISLNSTYVKAAIKSLPRTGDGQWVARTTYYKDMENATFGDIKTGIVWQE